MAAAVGGPLYTRGGADAPDERGGSMVEKHREKMQKAKEETALRMVRAAAPGLGPTVCALALEGAGWDADAALQLLQEFQADGATELVVLRQKRDELSKPAAAAASDDSGSDSDSSAGGERRSRKRRPRSNSRSKKSKEKKSSKSKRSSGSKKKRRREDSPRASKHSKAAAKDTDVEGVIKEGFGAHGILRETDMYAKRAEFQAWAIDVQKVDVEIMPKMEEKELFKTFMEDYNTCTLPHVKYYDLEAYEKRKAAKAAKKGVDPKDMERTAFDDEAERRNELAEKRREEQAERLRDAYNQLKYTAVGQAEAMREQDMLKMQMQTAYRTGDHETAEKIAARLMPDEVREEKWRQAQAAAAPK